MPPATTAQRGFTLIELSIRLVIIGLIVGGVLVGRDLIERAQISQIEKYNTVVHTFQLKYNALPGDIANAAQFGFVARAGAQFTLHFHLPVSMGGQFINKTLRGGLASR